MSRLLELFLVFLRLGLTSFGGPVAHLAYFRDEFVLRRKWLGEHAYADLVGLCQFLPGPASSQVGMALGLGRAGLVGAVAAWVGFTLPSALLMVLFALGVGGLAGVGDAGWLHGLKLVAVAVVAQAVMGMARTLTPDRARAGLAVLAAIGVLVLPGSLVQVLVIALAGLVGWFLLPAGEVVAGDDLPARVPRRVGVAALALFFGLLLALPAFSAADGGGLAFVEAFYRSGALVFGGGHVVLPLLEASVVRPGWVTPDAFLAGYGVVQAVPGPLFTFSAYLGAVARVGLNPWVGALVALVSIFLPAFLLVVGVLPFWGGLRVLPRVRSALRGVNAAVVGVLLAALYSPVFTAAVGEARDFAFALAAFGLLAYGRLPPWLVVGLAALAGWLLL